MSLLVVFGDMSGDECLIISARFSFRLCAVREERLQPGAWEKIADVLMWLQLLWILGGFALMAFLALKMFPGKRTSAEKAPRDPLHFTAGNYRFENLPNSASSASSRVVNFSARSSRRAN